MQRGHVQLEHQQHDLNVAVRGPPGPTPLLLCYRMNVAFTLKGLVRAVPELREFALAAAADCSGTVIDGSRLGRDNLYGDFSLI